MDHSTINRWVVRYSPALVKAFCRRKRPVGTSWRMDETYVKVRGHWKYFYRAVDKAGQTIDFLLTARRDKKAALRFLRRAIDGGRVPAKINVDKSGSNKSAILAIGEEHNVEIECRQCKYLNNIVEQDHRPVKRISRASLGFKNFGWAQNTLAGVELVHMIHKGQMRPNFARDLTPAEQFLASGGKTLGPDPGGQRMAKFSACELSGSADTTQDRFVVPRRAKDAV